MYSARHYASKNLHSMAPRFLHQVFAFLPLSRHGFEFPRAGMETAHLALLLPGAWWCLVRLSPVALRHGCCADFHTHYRMEEWKEYSRGPCISILGQSQNNPGEAVTEPERIQEHSPPIFAGGQHFFEYLQMRSVPEEDVSPRASSGPLDQLLQVKVS